jgi:hypothetical protein
MPSTCPAAPLTSQPRHDTTAPVVDDAKTAWRSAVLAHVALAAARAAASASAAATAARGLVTAA